MSLGRQSLSGIFQYVSFALTASDPEGHEAQRKLKFICYSGHRSKQRRFNSCWVQSMSELKQIKTVRKCLYMLGSNHVRVEANEDGEEMPSDVKKHINLELLGPGIEFQST